MFNTPESIEKTSAIAVVLLKHHDLKIVLNLKNFLMFMPNPIQQKEILTRSIVQLVESSPETTRWLLQNSDCLKPEVDVIAVIIQVLTDKLILWGIPQQNFHFNDSGELWINEPFKTQLVNYLRLHSNEPVAILINSLLNN